MDRTNGCLDDLKCFVACLFFEESQHPTFPQDRQRRRCTHVSPIFTHSSQACLSVFVILIWSVCLQFIFCPLLCLQFYTFFKNFPCSSSSNACRSCSCVFITIGPYHATGSCNGFPETRRNRIPSSPACTVTSSPRSKSISERLSASVGGVVSNHLTVSVGTVNGPDALQNFPL